MPELQVDQIVTRHENIIRKTGGDTRILSEANLHQLVFQANLIADMIPRAAFIFYTLIAYPAFREGNTDLAGEMVRQILSEGGYCVDSEYDTDLCHMAEGIHSFITEPEDIEEWLRNRCRKS